MKNLPLAIGFLALFVLFAITFLARPILDPDFFWHLKVGEWLTLHKTWPIPDPFNYTTPPDMEGWQLFIIKGYWLCQILYYMCYATLGWWGFFLLRIVLFVIFVSIVRKNKCDDNWFWFACSLVCVTTIFDWYPVDRPQFLSVVCFAWLYFFLDNLWAGKNKIERSDILTVAVVMLFWGNVHRGFILGQILLILTGIINAMWLLLKKEQRHIIGARFWLFVMTGIIAGSLNPNAFTYVPTLLQTLFDTSVLAKDSSALMAASNFEYASIWKIWQSSGRAIAVPYVLFVVLSLAVVLFSARRQSVFNLVMLGGAGVYAAMHVRYLAFFMLAALPVLLRGASSVPFFRIWRWGVVICSFLILGYLASDEKKNVSRVRSEGWISNRDFPVEVVDALLANDISGNLFNTYGWGGYLLWRLGPARQVFIDGRNLNSQVTRDALAAEMVDIGGGRMFWKEVFAKYQVSHAILPIVSGGRPYALTYAIARDPEWQIAYTSGNAALLLRREQ